MHRRPHIPKPRILLLLSALLAAPLPAEMDAAPSDAPASLVAPGAVVERLQSGFLFLEGPASDPEGNLTFSDPMDSKIYRRTLDGDISLLRENTDMDNGLYFDAGGNLIACATTARAVVSFSPTGERTIIADTYDGKPLNSPNDLWIDPKGGIYFTDPRYGMPEIGPIEQGGEHVYYITPDRQNVIRVADDLVRPNGLIGTDDGKTLYIADHGDRKTFAYAIQTDGTLADKRLFAPQGADGVTLDERGNLYLTGANVAIYDAEGRHIETIEMPEIPEIPETARRRSEAPANITFAGEGRRTLFICARTGLYAVRMAVRGHALAAETALGTGEAAAPGK